jgi:glycosyltransferase involved in cell wall biosynthesis
MKKKLLLLIIFALVIVSVNHAMQLQKLINETEAMDYKPIDFKPPKDIMIFDKESKNFIPFELPKISQENNFALSVIIPVHNVEKYLVESLDSVVKQKNKKPYEVILIENNSTDKSLEIAKSYAEKYPNITLIKQDGGGPGGARNSGMMLAQGEYITFLDSDDFFVEDAINLATDAIEKDKLEMILFTWYNYDNETKKSKIRKSLHNYNGEIIETKNSNFKEINNKLYFVAWGTLYKRQILSDSGILFKNNLFHEDHLFLLMLSSEDIRMKFIDQPILYYRQNRPGSIMFNAPKINHMITVYKEFKSFLKERGKYDKLETVFVDREIRVINNQAKNLPNKEAIALYKYLHNYFKEQKFEERGIKPIESQNIKLFNRIMKEEYLILVWQNSFKNLHTKLKIQLKNLF